MSTDALAVAESWALKVREVAVGYCSAARSSVNARTQAEAARRRAESYGYLRSLDLLIGMRAAAALIDEVLSETQWAGYRSRINAEAFWQVGP